VVLVVGIGEINTIRRIAGTVIYIVIFVESGIHEADSHSHIWEETILGRPHLRKFMKLIMGGVYKMIDLGYLDPSMRIRMPSFVAFVLALLVLLITVTIYHAGARVMFA
jgi:hypothetical protein